VTKRGEILGVPCELAAEQFEITLRRLADDLTYGSDASRFVGSGVDFAQSRPFVYGDSVRHIDWRVSARTGRVHVKEFEATKRAAMFLLVDTSASMGVSSTELSKHDLAVWAAGALALVGLRRRSPVALVSCGERESAASPTLSRALVWRWIQSLRADPAHERTRLVERIEQVETVARHTSLVIVISDLHEPGAGGAIKRLGQRHDAVVLHVQDPAEEGRLGAGFVRAVEAETGRGFIAGPRARFDVAEELAGGNIDHVVLRTDRPIIPALRRVLASHGRGMRSPR
jgi:uncharacterized protein (DUF58 family)